MKTLFRVLETFVILCQHFNFKGENGLETTLLCENLVSLNFGEIYFGEFNFGEFLYSLKIIYNDYSDHEVFFGRHQYYNMKQGLH